MYPPKPYEGRLHCEQHGRLTCKVCLHSINADLNGYIENPEKFKYDCPESEHSVKPRFEYFAGRAVELLGFRDGMSPTHRRQSVRDDFHPITNPKLYGDFACKECGLRYLAGGGIGMYGAHPSHVCADGQRYILVRVYPIKFARGVERIECTTHFYFNDNSKMDVIYTCMSRSDQGSADWNLENAEIAALTQLLTHVEEKLIPHRKELVEGYVYTNSTYFAGQAWRFNLLVLTSLNRDVLDLLLKAYNLKYSVKRKAFVERNVLGFVTKKFPATEERRYQVVSFIRKVRDLASLGIQVYWRHMKSNKTKAAARARFLDDPYQFPEPRYEVLEDDPNALNLEQEGGQITGEEDLLDGDSFQDLPSHYEFEAVEIKNPEESSEVSGLLETHRDVSPLSSDVDSPHETHRDVSPLSSEAGS
ncbi:hypothetical protein F5Y06DRAFT_229152 [Hypoxylon sp. FL0890]|nr:hypothetical protein F5Y06DRAFT_229152 [Hypoxylon sp. FL0890]